MTYMKSGSPFLYDEDSGDIVGVKDADGGESFFGRLSTTASGNTVLRGPEGAALQLTLADSKGAIGDGVTDDGNALQSAFDDGGPGVTLSAGKTYLVRNVKIGSNKFFYLNGATLKFGGSHGTAPISESVNTVLYAAGTVGARVSNIHIIGPGTIIGSRSGDDYTATGALEQDGISLQYADNVRIDGLLIEDQKQDAISLDNVSGVVVNGNTFNRSGDVCVDIRVGTEIYVTNNTAHDVRSLLSCKPNNTSVIVSGNVASTFGVGILLHGNNWRVINNTLTAMTTPDAQNGNSASGIEILSTTGAQTGLNFSRCVVSGNVIAGRTDATGIYLKTSAEGDPSDILMTGNVIEAQRGVLVEEGDAVSITQNIIRAGTKGGVKINGGTNILIEGNNITSSGFEAIYSVSPFSVIENNAAVTSGTIGIYLSSAADDSIINGNRVSGGTLGVQFFSDRTVVSGNRISSANGAGVSVQGQDASVQGNVISAASGEAVLVGGAGSTVSGNRMTAGTQGIRVSASNVVVSGNRISGQSFWGVNVSAGAVDTLVIANNLVGNTSGPILDAGTTTTASNNKP